MLRQAEQWDELHRWERRELGKALRRLGLTYSEIRVIVPVPKGTLSNWCRDIVLTSMQIAAIKERVSSQKEVPRDTQWRRRPEVSRIKIEARDQAQALLDQPDWAAGLALYWGEGAKTHGRLAVANADPRLLRVFMRWIETYLDPQPTYSASLNLHAANDEPAARRYWSNELGLQLASFTRTYIKPDGTGHRKNSLPHGVCRVALRRSTDAWIRTMVWIDVLAVKLGSLQAGDAANLAPGR